MLKKINFLYKSLPVDCYVDKYEDSLCEVVKKFILCMLDEVAAIIFLIL